eukprot:UN30063
MLMIIICLCRKIKRTPPDKPLAIVLGIWEYMNKDNLSTGPDDVASMVKALQDIGFVVKCFRNVTLEEFRTYLRSLDPVIQRSPILFYYTGHGCSQWAMENKNPDRYFIFGDDRCIGLHEIVHMKAIRDEDVACILDKCESRDGKDEKNKKGGKGNMDETFEEEDKEEEDIRGITTFS